MPLPPSPPMRGKALRVLVAAAESPGSAHLVYALMTRSMGIVDLLALTPEGEPMPVDERPVPFAGRR